MSISPTDPLLPSTASDLVVLYSTFAGGLITTTLNAANPVIIETYLSETTKLSSLTVYVLTSLVGSTTIYTSIGSSFSAVETEPVTVISRGNPTLLSVVLVPTSKSTSKSRTLANSASITTAATPSESQIVSSRQRSSVGLPGSAIAGIAIGATVVVLFLLAFGWCLKRRRRSRRNVKSESATFNRADSKTFRKAELEGTAGSSTFEWQPKPELPVTEVITPGAPDDIASRMPAAASDGQVINPHQELEAVPIIKSGIRSDEVPSPSIGITPTEQSEEPAASESTRPSQSATAIEGGLRRQHNNEISSPKHTVLTEPSQQDQAVVDASQLNKLKAQERDLAEYIEAHETLQKLKNEHIVLQERIRAAEERAQRLNTSDLG
jgi:hypothetical protein